MNATQLNTCILVDECLLFEDEGKHLIATLFSYVKPTMGPRFILHLLLSLSHFGTELDLMLRPS